MEFPAGESQCSNSSIWSQIHSRSPNLHSNNGENGFLAAGFTSSVPPSTVSSRVSSCISYCREGVRVWFRRGNECLRSPVPARVYGLSEDRFCGASAPPPGQSALPAGHHTPAELISGDKPLDRFSGATAPHRPGERSSSNSDSPPYLPSQTRMICERKGYRSESGFRDLAV